MQRSDCVRALDDRRIKLRMPAPSAALPQPNATSSLLAARLSDHWHRLQRENGSVSDIRLRVCQNLDSLLTTCSERLGSCDPVAGYTALLFVIETVSLEQHRDLPESASRRSALRSIIDQAADDSANAAMLEAYAFFVFTLIATSLVAMPIGTRAGD